MAKAEADESEMTRNRSRLVRKRVTIPAAIAVVVAVALGVAWTQRKDIAQNVIAGELRTYGLPGTYRIDSIEPGKQIIGNLVIGDPRKPDFTARTVVIRLHLRLGVPEIGSVTLIEPRLYGTQKNGRISFGSLDRVIYRKTGQPPGLPNLNLVVQDGRGLIHTDHGNLGIDLVGAGNLANGFEGTLAIAAPELAFGDCRAEGASLFGTVKTSAGKPGFSGPVRMASFECAGAHLALGQADAQVEASSDARLATYSGTASIKADSLRYGEYRATGSDITLRGAWRNGVLELKHSLALRGIETPYAAAALATLDGSAQFSHDFSRIDLRSELEGNGLRPGKSFKQGVEQLSRLGNGTLLAPLVDRFARKLDSEARGSAFVADLSLRKTGKRTVMIVPSAQLRGRSGARLASLSRVQALFGGTTSLDFVGNLSTAGSGMPRISVRVEQGQGNANVFQVEMEPYSDGASSLAIPALHIVRTRQGGLRFDGRLAASGPLPAGSASNLSLPIEGRYDSSGRLTLWNRCIDVGFDRLSFANLTLQKRGLTLCPGHGRPILENGPGGLHVAAGAPGLDLAGRLGETPIRLASGPVGFAYPGAMSAEHIDVSLGPEDGASRFTISNLNARLGENIAGRFEGADVRLHSVPFDLSDAAGDWAYANGRFEIGNASFALSDRQKPARFEPLSAQDAALSLAGNVIEARAQLRHPGTARIVTAVDLRHNLANGVGHADLTVAGLKFDSKLQPDQLTPLVRGLVANVEGEISGKGVIDWHGDKVTSSGTFASQDLDFAAAFGPVKGASGAVHFTDLIGLTTAPGQLLKVASVNPGIEVNDGELRFALAGGKQLAVAGASWPFMGGTLPLRKVDLDFGVKEERRYVFDIRGLDAGAFIQRMKLGNISATGKFDGTLPIVFDTDGNGRIEGGTLISRSPGGNVAYVGNLTYKDLSPIANFAFDALRSLDYDHMEISMGGPLTGEIVTQVRFQGVHQGDGTSRNFVTRQIARLPLEFRLNIRAPFYQLITSLNSLRDPAAVRDPRSLGLISDDGKRLIENEVRGEAAKPAVEAQDHIPDETPIQQQESENKP